MACSMFLKTFMNGAQIGSAESFTPVRQNATRKGLKPASAALPAAARGVTTSR
jgi:hypothetical protein